ncbi:MAG TPA: glycoside hydrolase family 3 C-terminal domain-containing protein, partial [Vicinamibacteria bacterium]|nr:glycoside hydrolase family 3 C-terminal domain-containing protein [Vicinamibacteria bacterium]
PVIVVLIGGSAITMPWLDRAGAVIDAWYPGEAGGDAVADVLFGAVNPAGRLPVTFYRSVDQLPPFADYDMKGRTYRYFHGDPLYPFGHGLSYTRFEYSDLRVDRPRVGARETATVSVRVKNVGARAGDEVVQLYARSLATKVPEVNKDLRGFARVPLAPGEQRVVTFELTPATALTHYDAGAKGLAVAPGDYEIQVGASSHDIRLTARLHVRP